MVNIERAMSSSNQAASSGKEASHRANFSHFTSINAPNSTPRLASWRPITASELRDNLPTFPTRQQEPQHDRTTSIKSPSSRFWQQDDGLGERALPSHFRSYPEEQSPFKRKQSTPPPRPSSSVQSPKGGRPAETRSESADVSKQHYVPTGLDMNAEHARKRMRLPASSVDCKLEAGTESSHSVYQRIEPRTEGNGLRIDDRREHEVHDLHQQRTPFPSEVKRANIKERKRLFSKRTKTGCLTCRNRKKKCDEGEPTCNNCIRGNFQCLGYSSRSGSGTSSSKPPALQSRSTQDPPPLQDQAGSAQSSSQSMVAAPDWTSSRMALSTVMEPRQVLPPLNGPDGMYGAQSWSRSCRSTSLEQSHDGIWPLEIGISAIRGRDSVLDQSDPSRRLIESEVAKTAPWSTGSSCGSNVEVMEPAPLVTKTEKEKMLVGRPYLHYMDRQLTAERTDCQLRLEIFNKACRPSSYSSAEDIRKKLLAVLHPAIARTPHDPRGSCGTNVVVEAPFKCDYGFNIHIGNDVVIQRDCEMQDPCKISIGDRTIIGPGVKFLGMTTHMDPALRRGAQGKFYGGSITVEEDCVIGAGVQILPYRTIGKGAVVGAGTVVSKDVQANTVVAGNPMKVLRDIDDPRRDTHKRLIQRENDIALALMVAERRRALEGRLDTNR